MQLSPQQEVVMVGVTPFRDGTTKGIAPVAVCSLARSLSHFSRKRLMSKLKQAVGENRAMSPVQPCRSSRWGQSVGMSTKLSRPLQLRFDCS